MTYSDANQKIRTHITEVVGIGAKPMIVYALDPEFLPEQVYDQLMNFQKNGNILNGYPWVMGLYWVRRFYEGGKGHNYAQCLDNEVDVQTQIFKTWKLGSKPSSDNFIVQCPLLRAENDGISSKLTKGIKFLANGLYPDFSEAEFQERKVAIAERQNGFSSDQIKSLSKYTSVFSEIIRTLLTGEGQGWLAKFVDHPLRYNFSLPQWGVHTNGPVGTIALSIRTSLKEIDFTQGNYCISKTVPQKELIVPLHEFLKAGFKCGVNITTRCGTTRLPILSDIRLARASGKRRFHSFILPLDDGGGIPAIQATSLYAVMPLDTHQAFKLGSSRVPTQPQILRNCPENKLALLDLSSIKRDQPIPLCNGEGVELLRVGAAPSLYPIGAENSFEVNGDRDTWIVFGDQVSIQLQGFHRLAEQIVWPDSVEGLGMSASLRCGVGEFGRKKNVRVVIPGRSYSISVSILFLPQAFLEAMRKEEQIEEGAISWTPEPDSEKIRIRVENADLCPGKLDVGNQQLLSLSVPSIKLHFWNFSGVNPIGSADNCSTYDSIDQMRYVRTVFYVPEGRHELLWDNKCLYELEGPVCWKFNFDEIAHDPDERSAYQRRLEIKNDSGSSTAILVCRAHPQVRRTGNKWELILPEGLDPANHRVAILSEGKIGAGLLLDESCADLDLDIDESGDAWVLGWTSQKAHPDQGVVLLLWKGSQTAIDILQLAVRPEGLYGPFTLQPQNHYRNAYSLWNEIEIPIAQALPLPHWVNTGWTNRQETQQQERLSDQAFLASFFTPETAAEHLNQMILSGSIWFADPRWGGCQRSLIKRINEVVAALQPPPMFGPGTLKISYDCKIFGQLVEVANGSYPAKAWLPISAFKIQPIAGNPETITKLDNFKLHTPRHSYKVWYEYGNHVSFFDLDRFQISKLDWIYDLEEIELNPVQNAFLTLEGIISDIFDNLLNEARDLVGIHSQCNLFLVLLDISTRLRDQRSIGQSILFQIATICRIRAWLPDHHASDREKEMISKIVSEAWRDQTNQYYLTSHLATVEWLLAWFRVSPSEDARVMNNPEPDGRLSHGEASSIGSYLNDSIIKSGQIWFADPTWGGRLNQGGPALVKRLAEISETLGPYGSKDWETQGTACSLLTAFAEIACGRFGSRMWIPRSWFKIGEFDDLEKKQTEIHFFYGCGARIKNINGFLKPLEWKFQNNPQTPRVDFKQIHVDSLQIDSVFSRQEEVIISRLFGIALDSCVSLIGNYHFKTDLAYFYLCLSSWFDFECGRNSGRPGIFRIAVLSRIRAWLSPAQAEELLDPNAMQQLSAFVQAIWNQPIQRDILIGDLAAVEWSLAWLHKTQ
jgi:hypothetical protein